MDKKTLESYDTKASHYTQDWLSQPEPEEIHKIALKYFIRAAPTADIGSGSGRDCKWLSDNGFPCVGFDASEGLLSEARKKFPDLAFNFSALADLKEIKDETFTNVLCETVLMHLPKETHEKSIENLLRITQSGGVLSLSWRHPINATNSREVDGRLYEEIDREKLIKIASKHAAICLYQNTITSTSSGKKIDQLVFVKSQ